jgi:hypothetical protein
VQLRAVHSSDVASLLLWSRRQSDAVGSVASYVAPPVRVLVAEPEGEEAAEKLTEIEQRCSNAGGFFGFDHFLLTDLDGTIRASSDEAWERGGLAGTMVELASVDVQTRGTAVSAPFLGPLGERRIAASSAIRSEAGAVIAVLHLLDDPADELFDVLAVSRPGDSGESYLFSDDGRLLSDSRFASALLASGRVADPTNAGGALELQLTTPDGLPTEPVLSAQLGEPSGVPIVYTSYLGTDVVGLWTWLPELRAGLATEVDIQEAYLPARRLRTTVVLLSVLLCLMILVLMASAMLLTELQTRARQAREVAEELGQYQLFGRLGQGSMGTVYRARHRLLQRPTAVKVLRDPGQARAIMRFEREVRMTAELTHPNTVQVYDFGRTEDGRFYYAMEYLPGIDLRGLIEVHGPQCSERVAHIIQQIAGSLSEAHAHGLVHRDVKAANVILCQRGGVPDIAKVCDFGLVVAMSDPESSVGGLIGTPIYLAPELIEPPYSPSPKSDLYALGCLAYELLVGRPPFGGSVKEVLAAQVSTPPIPLSLRVPGIGPAFEASVMSCIEKNPSDRPADASAIIDAIRLHGCADEWTPERARDWWAGQDPSLSGTAESSADRLRVDVNPTYRNRG